jgi:hypothetical protein
VTWVYHTAGHFVDTAPMVLIDAPKAGISQACCKLPCARLVSMNNEAKFVEECLTEAAECDRLAGLARSEAARRVMTLCATAWRDRAEKVKREIAARVRKSN